LSAYLRGVKWVVSVIGLALSTFLIVLDYTIANVSIPYIAGDLSVSANQGTYVITCFAVGNAIVLPISGWLTKRIGAVRLLLSSVLLFVLFSWLCGSAPSFTLLLVCRFLQGFVSGPLIPVSQSLLISTNPPEKKNGVLAFWSAVIIAAPVIGPVLGGWISFDYSWPWIFYINIPFGLISAFCIWWTLLPFETDKTKVPVDIVGFFLLAVGVTCLQIFLDRGEQYDWIRSNYMLTLIVTSILAFIYLIVWEYIRHDPMIDLRLFKVRSFSVSVIFIGIMYAMYFGSVVLIPLWLQLYMGYNAIWAGIAVAPIGIAPFCLSIFSGKVVNRFGPLRPLAVCFVVFAISCFDTALFTTAVDIEHIWISRFLLGCGLVLFIAPLFSLSVQDVSNAHLPQATGIFHFVRAMSGGIGTAVFNTLWIRRSAFHHARITSHITPTSDNTDAYISQMHDMGMRGQKIWGILNQKIDEQAAMLALNDCFYLMGWLFLLLLVLLPFGRKRKTLLLKRHE